MSKYKVEIGGFVSTYRQRNIIVYADNEAEAEEKAIDKFIEMQQEKVGNICNEARADSIEEL
ncbi:hypothetical protein [Anaerovorax sp. IOR16]|uniref:hypothetical protein n=1 Tax=Anaerovorax sp. IOR16 TaxID=2773458 RepID=UPI0019D253ED|nr:hypothetical protein [Anaerovorax sp. IOR16]